MTHTLKQCINSAARLLVAGTLALAGLPWAAPAPAHAAGLAQEGTPGPFADGTFIEYGCRQLGRTLEGQQDRLALAGDIIEKSRAWIDNLEALGKDVSALESALAAYQAALAAAQPQHDQAQSIYDAQAGFDGSCEMVDREQARTTLRDARDALRQAQRTLGDGSRAFHRAVQDWRRANRRAATPAP
jgi:hypothetical protein